MSQRRGSRRGTGWKPPRDRHEVLVAVLASLAVVVVTVALVWFLRPNQDSGSSVDTTPTTAAEVPTTTAVPPTTAVAPTAPAESSTP